MSAAKFVQTRAGLYISSAVLIVSAAVALPRLFSDSPHSESHVASPFKGLLLSPLPMLVPVGIDEMEEEKVVEEKVDLMPISGLPLPMLTLPTEEEVVETIATYEVEEPALPISYGDSSFISIPFGANSTEISEESEEALMTLLRKPEVALGSKILVQSYAPSSDDPDLTWDAGLRARKIYAMLKWQGVEVQQMKILPLRVDRSYRVDIVLEADRATLAVN